MKIRSPDKVIPAPDEVVEQVGGVTADAVDFIAGALINNPLTFIGRAVQRMNNNARRRF